MLFGCSASDDPAEGTPTAEVPELMRTQTSTDELPPEIVDAADVYDTRLVGNVQEVTVYVGTNDDAVCIVAVPVDVERFAAACSGELPVSVGLNSMTYILAGESATAGTGQTKLSDSVFYSSSG
jgi:hypothetical protein